MNKIAIIGFGGHITKNILPALARMDEISIEAIYVRDIEKYKEKAQANNVKLKYMDEPISDDVEWVYISTPISTHYVLSKQYILKGMNIICEKPLTSDSQDSSELVALAEASNVKIIEVCMYQYHKQFAHLKNIVAEKKDSIKVVKANFSIPHLSKDNIRYQKCLGGGGLLDVGYYPISLILSLFGRPENIKSKGYSEEGYEVDLNGVAIFEYSNFYCIAEWGIGLPYANEVMVLTENEEFNYNRIFSKPETLETEVIIKKGFESERKTIGADDQFVNMFNAIFNDRAMNDNMLLVNSVLNELHV